MSKVWTLHPEVARRSVAHAQSNTKARDHEPYYLLRGGRVGVREGLQLVCATPVKKTHAQVPRTDVAKRTMSQAYRGPTAAKSRVPHHVQSGGVIIAVFGRKGGSGKTTCAFNLAGALVARGWRCLLVDLDGQASLSRALSDEPVEQGIGSRIMQFDRGVDDIIRSVGDNLDLIPGDQSINGAAIALAENPTGPLRLGGLLRPLAGKYNAIVLDTAPNLGFSQNSALLGADIGIVPTRVGAQQDIDALLDTIAQREEHIRFGLRVAEIACLLPSSYEDQHATQRQGLASLHEQFGSLVASPVPFSGLIERALNARIPLVASHPRSAAAQSFVSLADRVAGAGVRL